MYIYNDIYIYICKYIYIYISLSKDGNQTWQFLWGCTCSMCCCGDPETAEPRCRLVSWNARQGLELWGHREQRKLILASMWKKTNKKNNQNLDFHKFLMFVCFFSLFFLFLFLCKTLHSLCCWTQKTGKAHGSENGELRMIMNRNDEYWWIRMDSDGYDMYVYIHKYVYVYIYIYNDG